MRADTLAENLGMIPELLFAHPGGYVSGQHEVPNDDGWPGWPSRSHAGEIFWHWGGERRVEGGNWGWKVAGLPMAWACQREALHSMAVIDAGITPTGRVIDELAGARVVRAVMDTALGFGRHLVNGPAASEGYDHGQKVAGVAMARGDNDAGLTGVVWDGGTRTFYQARTFEVDGETYVDLQDTRLLVNAALDAGHSILNLSLGYPGSDSAASRRYANELARVLADYEDHDFLLAVSAGNLNRDAADEAFPQVADPLVFSQGDEKAIVVGAVDRMLGRWEIDGTTGSNFGSLVEIFAPGQSIPTLSGGSGIELSFGTSFAAPFVSGAAALLWAFDPTLTAGDVKRYLIRGARAAQKKRELQGTAGTELVLNVYESLRLIAAERDLHRRRYAVTPRLYRESTRLWRPRRAGVQ